MVKLGKGAKAQGRPRKAPPPKEVEDSEEDEEMEESSEEEVPVKNTPATKEATPAKTTPGKKAATPAKPVATPGKKGATPAVAKNGKRAIQQEIEDEEDSAIDLTPRLTRAERIEIVLMSGERSNRVIAADFNARQPTRPPISHATVSKLLAKFRETGSVLDLPKCGLMKSVTNEETSVAVLAAFSKNPQCSTRRMSLETGISRTSLRRILATHKLQHLNEDDPDRRTEFA